MFRMEHIKFAPSSSNIRLGGAVKKTKREPKVYTRPMFGVVSPIGFYRSAWATKELAEAEIAHLTNWPISWHIVEGTFSWKEK